MKQKLKWIIITCGIFVGIWTIFKHFYPRHHDYCKDVEVNIQAGGGASRSFHYIILSVKGDQMTIGTSDDWIRYQTYHKPYPKCDIIVSREKDGPSAVVVQYDPNRQNNRHFFTLVQGVLGGSAWYGGP